MPPNICCVFNFSCKKKLLAITINIIEISVTNVVRVVEMAASRGTFRKLLLSRIKLILEKMARAMAKINFQLNNNLKIASGFKRFPDIKFRSPINTIENAVLKQYTNVQKIMINAIKKSYDLFSN
jgi:hypothetical protein